ncbi:MAG: LysR family transcriptional regulator [Oscillospiraceae bacterium]
MFLSAAEHLNFTRAAEEQCISQTAVSQQIKLLEQELGYALFVRGKRGVSLTPAGEVFYRQCRQLMIRYNGAAAQGKKVALGNATDLRIGYAGAYELWTIVSQIRKYHRQHPEAEIEFQLGSNQSLLSGLAEGAAGYGGALRLRRGARQGARQPRHALGSVHGHDQRFAPAGGEKKRSTPESSRACRSCSTARRTVSPRPG